jgi:hypothetical protein
MTRPTRTDTRNYSLRLSWLNGSVSAKRLSSGWRLGRFIPYIKLGRSLRFHPTDGLRGVCFHFGRLLVASNLTYSVDEYFAKYWAFRPLDSSRKKKPSKSHEKKRRVRRTTTLQRNTPRKSPKLKDSGSDDAGNNLRSDRLPEP